MQFPSNPLLAQGDWDEWQKKSLNESGFLGRITRVSIGRPCPDFRFLRRGIHRRLVRRFASDRCWLILFLVWLLCCLWWHNDLGNWIVAIQPSNYLSKLDTCRLLRRLIRMERWMESNNWWVVPCLLSSRWRWWVFHRSWCHKRWQANRNFYQLE